MKILTFIPSALALQVAQAYLVAPPGTPAPGAISSCSEWVQRSYGMRCAIIERLFGMTGVQLRAWVSVPQTAQFHAEFYVFLKP
jgi:hypothetical protein